MSAISRNITFEYRATESHVSGSNDLPGVLIPTEIMKTNRLDKEEKTLPSLDDLTLNKLGVVCHWCGGVQIAMLLFPG